MSSEYYGCSDGGCVFGHPGGQHTNGGCHCLDGLHVGVWRTRVRSGILALRKKNDQLREDLDRALESAFDSMSQACWVGEGRGDRQAFEKYGDHYNSMCLSSQAETMRLLARHGWLKIVEEHGRGVIALYLPREQRSHL